MTATKPFANFIIFKKFQKNFLIFKKKSHTKLAGIFNIYQKILLLCVQ